MAKTCYRGELYYADLGKGIGSEQEGCRAVFILQNDMGNRYSPTTIAAPVSCKVDTKAKLTTHYILEPVVGLVRPLVVLLEQVRVIDKHRLERKLGRLPDCHICDITSFKIVVSAGYDFTGTHILHRSIWTQPRHGMTERQMQKEDTAYAFKFEEQINNGYILDNNQPFFQYAQYVLQVKETEGVRPSTLDRYIELLVRINQKIGHLAIGKIRPSI